MKFVWLDQWYPEAYSAWLRTGGPPLHGTAEHWDIALRAAGHESETLLYNAEPDVLGIVANLQPDILCVQNVGMWYPALIRARGIKSKLVAFCSYKAAGENLLGWDVVFSSFPWLVAAMNAAGQQRAEYLPLAFGRTILDQVPAPPVRDLPLTFVGGLGSPIWKRGTDDLAAVAAAFPDEFKWWGYRVGGLPEELEKTFQGPAWGRQYWEILMRSKIVINRHGEIAKGFGNNMRNYEAPGCGAFLLTDHSGVLKGKGIWRYSDAAEASIISAVTLLLKKLFADDVYTLNQQYILNNHTYEHRVPQFLHVLETL